MAYKAVDCHNVMEGTAFRDEGLKIQTFVFQFLSLLATLLLTSDWLQVEEVLCRLDPGLTAARGKLLYEVTRFRMMSTLQQLQSRWGVAPSAQYSAVVSSAANRLIGEVVQSWRRPLPGPSPG